MANNKKVCNDTEKRYAYLLNEGHSYIEAARIAFGWKCEPHSKEREKAKNLRVSRRIVAERKKIKEHDDLEAGALAVLQNSDGANIDSMAKFAYNRLIEIRDNPKTPSRDVLRAINILEKLRDPSRETNLIHRYLYVLYQGYEAHCPACHKDFPLWKVPNEHLKKYIKERIEEKDPFTEEIQPITDQLERRLWVIGQAEKRELPHPGQLKLLKAQERHIVAKGAARAGKSKVLGWFAGLTLLIPGVEIWILARVYEDARSEFEYLEGFLKTMFGPVYRHMVHKYEDKKQNEVIYHAKWGSEARVKSARSKGSITGRELEAFLIAEPAWVDADVYEECRARMSSRLGRIIAIGTPKGYGGFLNRMIKMLGRGKDRRTKPEDKLIMNGCPWNTSILITDMKPADNPSYVKSEVDAARQELTDEEFAAEFEGLIVAGEGHVFPFIQNHHVRKVHAEETGRCVWVQGVDQGAKNFGACLVAYDGENIYAMKEYFKNDKTIKGNMIELMDNIGPWIRIGGGEIKKWKLTIFDVDPLLTNTFIELDNEGRGWPTPFTFRPKNKPEFLNWRHEVTNWLNQKAKDSKLWFDSDGAYILHDQLQEALIRAPAEGSEKKQSASKKNWIINDPMYGDHIPDAFLLACWAIYCGQVDGVEEVLAPAHDLYEEVRKGQKVRRMQDEARDLQGFDPTWRDATPEDIFQD